ncbi:MAG: hypothetical protein MPW16_01910 [Candidatus Manganitrophus sp.]|nr:MAG: hypothetical protein MPW16_01910 [Candidatus Manganitrophus sp.]
MTGRHVYDDLEVFGSIAAENLGMPRSSFKMIALGIRCRVVVISKNTAAEMQGKGIFKRPFRVTPKILAMPSPSRGMLSCRDRKNSAANRALGIFWTSPEALTGKLLSTSPPLLRKRSRPIFKLLAQRSR